MTVRRRSAHGSSRPIALAAVAAVVVATGGTGCVSEPGPGWAGVVDTLPGGVVAVRNPEQGTWTPETRRGLVEDLRLGSLDAEGPELFGSVAGLAVDADDRIYVLDRQAREVRLFDREGRHVRTIGREGGGPGEFGDPIAVAVDPDGDLLVVDVGNGRYARFDSTGAYLGSTPRTVGGYSVPARVTFDADGRFYEGALASFDEGWGRAVLRFEPGLERSEAFGLPEVSVPEFELRLGTTRMTAPVPFAPRQLWALDPRGRYWTAMTDRMRFVEHALDGDTIRVIERPSDPIPTTAEDRERAIVGLEWFTRQGGRVDPAAIPDTRPLLQGFAVSDSGRLWVEVTTVDPEVRYRFDVYDAEGVYLGGIDSDLAFSPWPLVVRGRVYGVTSDSLGVTYVVRATIEGQR